MNIIRKTFSTNIKRIHEESGFKQIHVCRKLGISKQAAYDWITCKVMPQPEWIVKLADLYGVDWLEFFMPIEDDK